MTGQESYLQNRVENLSAQLEVMSQAFQAACTRNAELRAQVEHLNEVIEQYEQEAR